MILNYEHYELNGFPVFERVTFAPPFKPSVTYDQEACFIYSLSGKGQLYGGVAQNTVSPNESILMKCGSFLNHWRASEDGKPCKIIAIHVTPDVLNRVYQNALPDFLTAQHSSTMIFERISQQLVIDEYIKGLVFYFDHPELINEDLIILKLKELILLLYQVDYGNIRLLLSTLFTPVDLSFKSIIEAHLYEELELKDFAALTNTSLSTFKRRFKQIFQEPPAQFIMHKRLEKAANLLKTSRNSVTEICFNCGFKDLSAFSKSFSKRFGMSPLSYRKAS